MSPFADPVSELLATPLMFQDPLRYQWARRVTRRYFQLFGESAITWRSK